MAWLPPTSASATSHPPLPSPGIPRPHPPLRPQPHVRHSTSGFSRGRVRDPVSGCPAFTHLCVRRSAFATPCLGFLRVVSTAPLPGLLRGLSYVVTFTHHLCVGRSAFVTSRLGFSQVASATRVRVAHVDSSLRPPISTFAAYHCPTASAQGAWPVPPRPAVVSAPPSPSPPRPLTTAAAPLHLHPAATPAPFTASGPHPHPPHRHVAPLPPRRTPSHHAAPLAS